MTAPIPSPDASTAGNADDRVNAPPRPDAGFDDSAHAGQGLAHIGQGADAPRSPEPTAGFRKLAQTLRSRTTDLLAIAIVLMGGLTLGSQLSDWWATDPADLLPPGPPAAEDVFWGAGGVPVTLEFGDMPYAVERRTFQGNREQAGQQLIRICADAVRTTELAAAASPAGPSPETATSQLDNAERTLLAKLSLLKPAVEEPNVWQVYRIREPFGMIVGTRFTDGGKVADDGNRRVVCWGLATPGGEQVWTLFLFRRASSGNSSRVTSGEVSLPAGAVRLLSLGEAGGRKMIGLEGSGSAEGWRRHFDDWGSQHGWVLRRPWTKTEAGWHGGYVHPGERSTSIDIQFDRGTDGKVRGLIHITPQ